MTKFNTCNFAPDFDRREQSDRLFTINKPSKNMHITTVSVEYRRKFNIGNYESLELGISLYAKVNVDEDAEGVAELLWEQAKASVKAQAAPVLKGVNYQAQVKHKESWATVSDDEGGF